ncbi:hypothetical protein Trydic_g4811, partial [Trypoxylus dichotomus]
EVKVTKPKAPGVGEDFKSFMELSGGAFSEAMICVSH